MIYNNIHKVVFIIDIDMCNCVAFLGSVVVSMIASGGFGAFWYSSKAFGKVWEKEFSVNGQKLCAGKKDFLRSLGLEYLAVFLFVSAVFYLSSSINVLVSDFTDCYLMQRILPGAMMWMGFSLPAVLAAVAWELRSWQYFFVKSSHTFVVFQIVYNVVCFFKGF